MKKIVLMSLVASGILMAGGYKIPEVSTNAVALGAANIAHNKNADAAYYNPANMVWMEDTNHMQFNAMYIGLDEVQFSGTNEHAKKEGFLIPSFHYVSPKLGDSGARIGVSVVVPGGLSKRWEGPVGKRSSEEFTLETIEINPTAAFEITPELAVAVGFRMIHSNGIVKNAAYDMTGDGLNFGYNFALAYTPVKSLELGVTYRSKISLDLDGSTSRILTPSNTDVSVSVPLPAALNLAVAYTFPSKTTLEFVYERTYWSAYSDLDFDFTDPRAEGAFGASHPKDWKDTNTFRLGITQEIGDFDVMAGLVFDETPVPDATIGFELPDSDSVAVSLGGSYSITDKWDVYVSGLYSMHDKRNATVDVGRGTLVNGEFSNADVLILSTGFGFKF